MKKKSGKPMELTARKQQVVRLVAQGMKNHEVGKAMGTTANVIANYLRDIYDKLGMWNRTELALWYESKREK